MNLISFCTDLFYAILAKECNMEKLTARVHSFESFGTVDGPGLRFVIFFQGCHLRCKYCHNRDQWDLNGGKEYTVQELFTEVKKYRPYFESSGGGITATGGDPILQTAAISELFSLCKKAGIHTTLDTSGVTKITENVKKLLSYTDLVLLDIKEMDDERHRTLTKVSNERVFEFAQYLNNERIPVWIRHVVIPGITDFTSVALPTFLKSLSNVERLDILPFHKMGEFKWEELGEEYSLHDTQPPTSENIDELKECYSDLPFQVVIGSS